MFIYYWVCTEPDEGCDGVCHLQFQDKEDLTLLKPDHCPYNYGPKNWELVCRTEVEEDE